MTDRAKRARIRSVDAAVARTNRAVGAMVNAVMQEALGDDVNFSENVARTKYEEAEENLDRALMLIRDVRRSYEGKEE